LDVLGVSRTLMRELAHSTGEAVHLARRVPSGGGVYVAQERPGVQQISVETEIGARPPLHCTATGKALIVDADEEELRRLLSEPFQQHTWRTVITFEALCRNLAETRERGYAIDDEEFQADVRCVAAPISDLMGRTVACVGISGPTTRITLCHLSELGELVAN